MAKYQVSIRAESLDELKTEVTAFYSSLLGSSVATSTPVDEDSEDAEETVEEKPKRTRRTKKQIEEDEAEQEDIEAEPEAEDDEDVGAEPEAEDDEDDFISEAELKKVKLALNASSKSRGREATLKILKKFAPASTQIKAKDFKKVMKALA